MRIRQHPSTDRFSHSTRAWLRSAQGRRQFALAALVGALVVVALGLLWRSGIWRKAEAPVAEVLAEAQHTLDEHLTRNALPNLSLDIPFEAYQILAAKRDVALVKGVLQSAEDDWQRATLRVGEESLSVRVRLKGDWLDHLGENKWSFVVETRNNAAYEGMRLFSLQSPATRGYLNEWLFLSELRRAGILAPRYAFVNLSVNGANWGVYALEESFSKELLESQQRRESVMVRYDESLVWERNAWADGSELATNWDPAANFGRQAFALVDEFNTNTVQSNPVLSQQSDAALGLLRGYQSGELGAAEVFDVDFLGRYLAQTTLWHAGHGLVWFNERYYYNPLTTRLEPIAYDTLAMRSVGFRDGLAQYDDLAVAESFAREARRISNPAYLAELQALYSDAFERYHEALAQEFAPADLEPPWSTLSDRQSVLNAIFVDQTQPVYAYRVSGDAQAGIQLLVGNLLAYPVALLELCGNGLSADISPEWLTDADRALIYGDTGDRVVLKRADEIAPRYVTLNVPPEVAATLVPAGSASTGTELQLSTLLIGLTDPYTTTVTADYPAALTRSVLPEAPTLDEVLARHPFLAVRDERTLELLPGAWDVDGDLLLPTGYALVGSGATTLRFEQGAVFLTTGALRLQAPAERPVRLMARDEPWAGLMVLQAGADAPSLLENVEVSGTLGIDRDGWYATGGVTFYESDVRIVGGRFTASMSEDALNIVRSTFEISGTLFSDLASDALDGDFSTGSVTNAVFQDVRGDCIDVSGSQVTVTSVSMTHIADKGVSAGEGSRVTVHGLRANDIGIAIASKDMSDVQARDVRVHRAAVAALATYVKKLEYGSASITADALLISDDSPRALVQHGSSISIDGRPVTPTSVDVDALYALLEARGGMQPLGYQLGPSIRLEGYYLATPTLKAGEPLQLVLQYRADQRVSSDYTVFVHMLAEDGRIVKQHDAMPSGGTMPTSSWAIDRPVYDAISIDLPDALAPGSYTMVTGLYLWQTGDRLPVTDSAGAAVPNDAVALPARLSVLP